MVEVELASVDKLALIQEMNRELFEWDRERDPKMNFDWSLSEVGENYFRKRITTEGVCFVAIIDGETVGYLAGALRANELWRVTRRSEVENMFVGADHRGSGAGRALIEAFAQWSKQAGAEQVLVEAFWGNSAIDFYQQIGFSPAALSLQMDL